MKREDQVRAQFPSVYPPRNDVIAHVSCHPLLLQYLTIPQEPSYGPLPHTCRVSRSTSRVIAL